nr:putative Mg2+ transporter protein, CorA-like/zinc transport protein ZntB [Tanacetum cinerariifolium]
PYCAHVDGALVFRVNSPGPPSSKFTFRLAARITKNSVITVSLGRVPRLGFSPVGQSLLSEIPRVESPNSKVGRDDTVDRGGILIKEHVLDFLLTMNHSEEADNPVPRSVSNLVVHIIDTHVDHLEDVVTKLEIELNSVEADLDKGGFSLKRQLLDDRRFPKMHLDLQRLLQVIAHGEQVFPRVKEKLAARITKNSVITVSLGRVPRLGFSPVGQSLLSEIPRVESPSSKVGRDETVDRGGILIKEHVLDFLLTMNHSEEAD